MAVVSVSSLLESGVHYGHQKKRWNPKMGEYIWGPKEDIHLIDIYKTAEALEVVVEKIKEIVEKGGQLLFVGTKKQAQEVTKEEALRCKMFFMNQRWLGGTLTNFKTIRDRIKRIEDIEKMEIDGTFELLPKKEVFGIKKEYDKLNLYLQGIRDMKKMPGALIVVDTLKEVNAIREAKKLNIPVFGIIDTNCDPDVVDYVIPANDDAIKSIKIIFAVIANAANQVNGGEISDFVTNDMDKKVNLAEVAAKPFAPRKDNRNFNNNRGFNRYNNDNRNSYNNDNRNNNNDTRNNSGNGYNNDNRNNNNNTENRPSTENRYNNDNRNNNGNGYNNNNNRTFERKEVVAQPTVKAAVVEAKEVVVPPVVQEVKKVEVKEDLSKFTVAKLKELAKEKGIAGYTTMKKDELVTALS